MRFRDEALGSKKRLIRHDLGLFFDAGIGCRCPDGHRDRFGCLGCVDFDAMAIPGLSAACCGDWHSRQAASRARRGWSGFSCS